MEELISVMNSSTFFNSCVDIGEYAVEHTSDWTTLTGVRVIVGVVYALIFLLGVFGNAGVITRVINDKKLHSAQYVFLVNLMASDFLLCLTSVPFSPVAIIMKHWIFGVVLCRAIPLCQAMSVVITSLSLTLIAVDKYVHIIDATRPPVSLAQAFVAIGLIWTVACGLSLPLVLSYGVRDGSAYYEEFGVYFCGNFCDESWRPEYKRIYGTSIMCIQFVLPMFIIAFCYSAIMRKVKRDMMIENKQFGSCLSNSQRIEAIRRKRKVTYILIMMVVAFIGSWAPLTLFNIFRDFSQLPTFVDNQPYFFALIVHCPAMSSVIWNPLLFFWLTGRQQRGSRKASIVTDSAIISFLLALNPIRAMFKRRSRQSESEKSVMRTGPGSSGSQFESSTPTPGMSTHNFSPMSCTSFRDAVSFDPGGSSESRTYPAVIVNPLAEGIVINGHARSVPTALECYRLLTDTRLLSSPRAPRVIAESMSDLSLFEMDAIDTTRDEKPDSGSSVDEEFELETTAKKKNRRSKGQRKALIYVHLGKSSHF